MNNKDALKEPIRSLSDWKKTVFPNLNNEEQDDNTSPTDLAVKLSTKAISSLPNKSIKPTQ